MKAAPSRLIQQGQQRGSEILHLLLRLSAGSGGLRRKLSTQPRDLSRKPVVLITETGDLDRQPVVLVTKAGVLACKPVVLGREGCHLLLSKPGAGLGFVPLLLAELHPIAPQTGRGILSRFTHAETCSQSRAPLPQPQTALRGSQADLRHGRWPAPSDAELQPVPQVRAAFSVLSTDDQGCDAVGYGEVGESLSG
jgi:hypothetical protein